jgi:two-component system, chemotaxis family, chemotaxis protein CheY
MKKFLVVDDSNITIKQFEKILLDNKENQVEMLVANDGLEAVEIYKTNIPDLVFLDIIMPKMDGIVALAELLAYDPESKIVVVSSLNSERHIEAVKRLGAKDYIPKPFNKEEVDNAIKKIISDWK